jgi:hypothetical protein
MKGLNIFIFGSLATVLPLFAYMPPPAQTHWDGYGSDPYTKGPSQANQLNQLGNRPKVQKKPFDQNFNNNQFQTSNPDYRDYGASTSSYDTKQFYFDGQYYYPNPTQWQYTPLNQPQVLDTNATGRTQPVLQNQLVPTEQPNHPMNVPVQQTYQTYRQPSNYQYQQSPTVTTTSQYNPGVQAPPSYQIVPQYTYPGTTPNSQQDYQNMPQNQPRPVPNQLRR